MLRKVFTLMAIVSVLCACEVRAAIISSTWGGGDGLWGDPSNWNPPVVPDNTWKDTYAVTIDSSDGAVRVGLLQDFTIDQLDCYGNVEIVKRTLGWKEFVPTIKFTLSDPKGLTNYGYLELEGCDGMRIIGNVTNTAGSDLEIWGRLDIEKGNLYNGPDAHIQIGGDDIVIEDGGLDNRGSITIDPETEFISNHTLHNTGQIHIRGGQCQTDEILDNDSTGIIEGFGYIYAEQLLQNKGQIIASSGTLSILTDGSMTNTGTIKNNAGTTLHIQAAATDINNEGVISVNAGGAVTFNCGLNNKPNSILQLKGGTFAATKLIQNPSATFEGFGGITGDVIIDPDGIIRLTGPTNIVGDVTIEDNAVLEISDGQVIVTGHTACNGTIRIKGGRFVPQGGLSGNCNIISESSEYNNMEDLAFLAETWLSQTN